jgi:hypothetical protein
LFEGKRVNLRVEEKADLLRNLELMNDPDYFGEFVPLVQRSRSDLEARYERMDPEEKRFVIERKDGSRIGGIVFFSGGGRCGDRLCS